MQNVFIEMLLLNHYIWSYITCIAIFYADMENSMT